MLLIAVLLQVVYQPYEDALMGRLESLSLCAVLGSLLLGNAIALGGLSPTSEAVVRTLAALINIGVLGYFAHCIVRSMRDLDLDIKQRAEQGQQEMRTLRQSTVASNPLVDGENPGAPDDAPTTF